MTPVRTKLWIQIVMSIALLISGDLGDYIQDRPSVRACRLGLAVLDNYIHLIIGLFSWIVVDPNSVSTLTPELLLVGLGSSLIDVDHFIAARSLTIQGAMSAPHRGIFHCSGFLLVIALVLLAFDLNWATVLLISFVPHHLRDSTRRGLYLYPPLVHSAPLPKALVRVLLPLFPWVICFIRNKYWVQAGAGYKRVPGTNYAFMTMEL